VGINSGGYKLALVAHILCSIVGFGAVFLNGLYGRQVKSKRGPEGLAIFQANELVSNVAEFFIYAVFVLGLLLVWLSDGAWAFGDLWVWSSIVLFLLALGLAQGVLRPALRRMERLMTELVIAGPAPPGASGPPPQVTQIGDLGRRVGLAGTALNLLLIAILFLMVWKP
jgi:predicted integral membrane protein DUF2269